MRKGVGVDLEDIWIRFGDFVAVRDANVGIEGGAFFSFLGPSGCGKTTILRAISGFLEPSQGRILIGGRDMAGIGPNRRPTALIFQNLALFPLMKVWENIAFALEVKGAGVAARRKRADQLLELTALTGQGDKMVGELSGGQRQRVAIARALCAEPDVLLLDEPLSALDLKLRQHMRTELRAIQQRVGITFIYITHDQGEALTMSDQVAVMRAGVIDQVADGRTIYDDPATPFVASFVGESNVFRGKIKDVAGGFAQVATADGELRARVGGNAKTAFQPGADAMLFVRPELLRIANGRAADGADEENRLIARIRTAEFEGQAYNVFLESRAGKEIKMALVNQRQARESAEGEDLTVVFDPGQAFVLPAGELAVE